MLVTFQALQTFGFYGFSNWAPTFLLKRGFTLLHSLKYTLLIAMVAPIGPLFAAVTSDRMERKWTIAALAILVAAFGLGFALWSAPVLIVLQKLSQTARGELIAYTGRTRPLNSCHSPISTMTATIRPMMIVRPARESGETFVFGTIPGPARLGSATFWPISVAAIALPF